MFSSHVLCKVDDLHAAVEAWRDAGFTVQFGDAGSRAINALVWFDEGPFIELILAERARPPRAFEFVVKHLLRSRWVQRFDRWATQRDGWCELALETHGSVKPVVAEAREWGLKVFGPVNNRRQPPDSPPIKTQTAFPHDLDLPILMGAYRPNPRPTRTAHANGASGIRQIALELPERAQAALKRLLDADERWLTVTTGPSLRIHHVVVDGLRETIDPERINNAILLRADA
ncbi:MAG: VOC family protein [Pseudomonadota bacterium]